MMDWPGSQAQSLRNYGALLMTPSWYSATLEAGFITPATRKSDGMSRDCR